MHGYLQSIEWKYYSVYRIESHIFNQIAVKPLQIWQNDGILCIMIKFVKGSLGIWYQDIQGIEKANV